MPTPNKPLELMSKNLTKAEIIARREQEEQLRGSADNITPSDYLSDEMKDVFYSIVAELEGTKILSNLDVSLIEEYAKCTVLLKQMDEMVIKNPQNLFDKQWLSSRNSFLKSLQKCWTELGLSPSSRAKLGNMNIANKEKEKDPLLNALKVIK